jgi:glycyl-tRNA synthetase
MAESKENVLMEKIVSLCKRRGFIFQSSEIYGGINGFWDYGPLGAELKRNVKDLWWNTMTRRRDDVVGLEATIIMSPRIWEASGHVDTFADLMRECPLTKKRVRADQVEPLSGTAFCYAGSVSKKAFDTVMPLWSQMLNQQSEDVRRSSLLQLASQILNQAKPSSEEDAKTVAENVIASIGGNRQTAATQALSLLSIVANLRAESSNEPFTILVALGKPPESARKTATEFYSQRGVVEPILFGERIEKLENSTDFHPESRVWLSDPRPFNLMFKTYVGPVESEDNVAYLRPETAQAIFAQFKNVLETSRRKVPFGIAQVGKAFRNEVTPRNFTFRSREFEQMELEFFIKPDEVVEAIAGRVAKASEISKEDNQQPTSNIQHSTFNIQQPIPAADWGWEAWHKYWVEERIRFYEGIGLPRTTLEEYWQKPEELAHYARACVDILFKFPFGTQELEGIAARSDFDLSQHERCSGKSMGVFDEELRAAWSKLDDAKKEALSRRYHEARLKYLTKMGVEQAAAEQEAKEDAAGLAKGQYIPHVIEPSAGVDRLILALICNAYHEDQMPDEKGKPEMRVVLKFHPRVAPIKVGVMPLLKNKPDLVKKALEIRDLMRPHMNVFYDDAGAIGRRYRRQDEAGTPFCVTVDFETLEGMKEGPLAGQKDTVTLRHRDDGRQDRVKISELLPLMLERIH